MELRMIESASLGTVAVNIDKITFLETIGVGFVKIHMGADHSVTAKGHLNEVVEKLF